MKKIFFKKSGEIFRRLPTFRGKYLIGKTLRKILFPNLEFQDPYVWIKMKKNFFLRVSLVNDTDFIPFWCGIYDTELIEKFSTIFQTDWVILDIGANIGTYTIPFSKANKGTIYSFEPLSMNYDLLVQAIKKNNCSNVRTFNLGLGEEKGEVGICLTEKGSSGNAVITNELLVEERGFFPTELIKIERLDDFYSEKNIHRCDFIKIDIEGAEIFFLRGAKNVIEKYRPIIYGEFNSYFIEKNKQSFREVWDLFKGMNYRLYKQNVVRNHNRLTTFSKVEVYEEGLENLLLIPNETEPSLRNFLIN